MVVADFKILVLAAWRCAGAALRLELIGSHAAATVAARTPGWIGYHSVPETATAALAVVMMKLGSLQSSHLKSAGTDNGDRQCQTSSI